MQMLFSGEGGGVGETGFYAENLVIIWQKLKKTPSAARRRGEAGH